MGISLNDNIITASNKSLDSRYGPYASTELVDIPQTRRYIGLTVGILTDDPLNPITEYWYNTPELDTLNPKKSDGNVTSIGEGNGISINSSNPLIPTVSIDTAVVQITDNISTDIPTDAASDTYYPSVKATKTYVDGLVVGLLNDRGNYDASVNTYPADGGSGGSGPTGILKGDIWFIDTAGTLGGIAVTVGSSVRALDDNPGQDDTKWDILDVGLGYIPENVDNKVTTKTKITEDPNSTTNYPSVSALTQYVGDALNLKYTPAFTDNIESIEVGGAVPTPVITWKTLTLSQVFDKILFKTQYPTYANPTIEVSGLSSSIQEIGSTLAISFKPYAEKKEAGDFTRLRSFKNGSVVATYTSTPLPSTIVVNTLSAIAGQFGFPNPNSPNNSYTSTTSYTESLTIPAPASTGTSSSTIYKVDGNYDAGLVKKRSDGNDDERASKVRNNPIAGPQAADTNFESSDVTVTGYYPWYWGVSTTSLTTAQIATIINSGTEGTDYHKTVGNAANTINVNFSATGKYLWFAIYKEYSDKTKYSPTWQSGAPILTIGTGGSLWKSATTQSIISPNSYWTKDYKVYVSNYATTTAGSMDLIQ